MNSQTWIFGKAIRYNLPEFHSVIHKTQHKNGMRWKGAVVLKLKNVNRTFCLDAMFHCDVIEK